MKKIVLFGGAAAMLLTGASCSSELDEPGNGHDGNVHFTVELPAQMRTRALADGTTASTLTYAVYESGSKTPIEVSEDQVKFDATTLTAQVDLRLVNGKSYDIIFWADAPNQSAYTFKANTQQVSIDYSNVSGNDETRDAFFAATTLDVTGPVNKTVELYRPFAQVNLGTDDLNSAAAKAAYADGLQVALSTTAYNTLDLLTGEVSGETAVTFKAAPVTDLASATFPYNPNTGEATPYSYIAMDYILVDSEKEVIDVEYTFYNGTVANQQTLPVSNVPVQRNYQTNIYGSLLTSPASLAIVIRPAFMEPDYNQEVKVVSTVEQTMAAIAAGGEVLLTAPVASLDLTTVNPAAPVNLTLAAAVGELKLGTTEANPQPVTITVKKDVAYPQFVMPGKDSAIRNLTIKGDLNSTERCAGFDAQATSTNPGCPVIENLTFENVPFTGQGVNVGYTANPQTVRNVSVVNCDFADLVKPAFSCSNNKYAGTVVEDITVKGNTIEINAEAPTSTNGIYICETTGGTVTLADNVISGGNKHGIMLGNNAANFVITGNTISNIGEDCVKMDQPQNNVTVSNNTLTPKEYAIRIARFQTDYAPTINIYGNSIDLSNCTLSDSKYAIYLGYSSQEGSTATVNVNDNIKAGGECDSWFFMEPAITASASSDYSNPFAE